MITISADQLKDTGELFALAHGEPVTVTDGGQPALVVLPLDEYERLRRGRRQVYLSAETPEYMLAALDEAAHALKQEIAASAPARGAAQR